MSSASARVRELGERTRPKLGEGPARVRVERVLADLDGPLRVAVAGPVNAGKSTLVNALLERKIAPTAASECTRVVTWFEQSYPERVTLRLRSGVERQLRRSGDGRLPDQLGEPPEAIDSLRVTLSAAALEGMTIIDTPGLMSANEELSRSSEKLLGSSGQAEPAAVDALVYVFTQDAREESRAALERFQKQVGAMRASAVNTIGVLGKADMIGSRGDDALSEAGALAEQLGRSLGALVSEVLPVVALLAETATTSFRAADAHNLCRLADLGPDARRRMLQSVRGFDRQESDVPPDERQRLMRLLGLFGIAQCFRLIDEGCRDNAALGDALRKRSGIDTLRHRLWTSFSQHSDVLKAERAFEELTRTAYSPANGTDAGVLGALRGELDDLKLEPEMHHLDEVWALQEAAALADEFGEELAAELRRVIMEETIEGKLALPSGASVAELQRTAAAGADRWQAFATGMRATPTACRIGRVVDRSYVHLWERAAGVSTAR